MPESSNKLTTGQLGRLIYEIRGERVMLDSDLASIYGVETKSLNRAVKRNADRFPKDFMFQISADEWQNLKYQIGTSSSGHGGRRRRPYAFPEHGAIMAANVGHSRCPRQLPSLHLRLPARLPLARVFNSALAVQLNTTCGGVVVWTAFSVWETGERSGELESQCLAYEGSGKCSHCSGIRSSLLNVTPGNCTTRSAASAVPF